ncbi:MAG: DNA mismatch repair endonuclease MutL [Clostridia bacterium]|nr:DNA mismatch repair endonuclease MutL [Clostridia bacterium]
MGDIVLLDEQTINKIAAGEVVDRPASIVKELVENSIDAKATAITVEIKKGGISYIKITDNGTGFHSDDIEMAFERHATSKIRKEEDLQKITSMGFRGEALASVAAIAKVVLTTKNVNEEIGSKVRVEAGNIVSRKEIPCNTGTTIEIYDVFYNVPARFKFLKKDYTEAGYIEDAVTRIALAYPHISFRYINNGKTIIQTSGTGNLHDTIYDIFGKEVYNAVLPIDYESGDMKVFGMIGKPVISRSTRMHQFIYINNRYIKDKTISSAIDRACEEKFAISKHAFIVCNIYMNPSLIDVNVHPAKLEVKFADESKIFDVVYHAVRGAIENDNRNNSPFTIARAELEASKETLDNPNVVVEDKVTEETKKQIEQISKDLMNNGVIPNPEKEKKYSFETATSRLYKQQPQEPVNVNSLLDSLNEKMGGDINTDTTEEKDEKEIVEETPFEQAKFEVESYEDTTMDKVDTLYEYIGHVFDTYIIIRMKDKIYFVDQHAAHERYLFEQIKDAYYKKDQETQMLLIPLLIGLSNKEMGIVRDNIEMFENAGFILDEFDDNTYKVAGVPNVGYNIDHKSMFKDMITELSTTEKTERQTKEHRFLATLACKAAVKGGMKLDVEEQKRLVDNMIVLDNPFTCPHGRPTAVPMTRYEIERKFMRK